MPNTHPAVEIISGVRFSHPTTDAIIVFRWVSCTRKVVQKVLKPPLMVFIEQRTIALACVYIFPFISCKLLAVVTALQPSQHKSDLQTKSVHSLFFPSLLLSVIAFGVHLLKGKVILHPQCIFFLLFS